MPSHPSLSLNRQYVRICTHGGGRDRISQGITLSAMRCGFLHTKISLSSANFQDSPIVERQLKQELRASTWTEITSASPRGAKALPSFPSLEEHNLLKVETLTQQPTLSPLLTKEEPFPYQRNILYQVNPSYQAVPTEPHAFHDSNDSMRHRSIHYMSQIWQSICICSESTWYAVPWNGISLYYMNCACTSLTRQKLKCRKQTPNPSLSPSYKNQRPNNMHLHLLSKRIYICVNPWHCDPDHRKNSLEKKKGSLEMGILKGYGFIDYYRERPSQNIHITYYIKSPTNSLGSIVVHVKHSGDNEK